MRAAVIGCGAISKNHIAAILASNQTLCALCDIDRAAAEQKAEEFQLNIPIYSNFSELLQKEAPDCVHICTPHYLHVPMCAEALEKDINVLCEKPLAITMDGLRAVTEAEKASRATLGICLQNRYEPNMVQMKKAAESGVTSLAGSVFWNRDEAYYASGPWRGKWETEGGGVMINQALHTLDLLQYLGGMPKYVTAHCHNDHLKDVIEVEDTAVARLEMEDGRVFSFFATTACGSSFPAMVQMKTADKKTVIATNKMLTVNGQPLPQQIREAMGKSVWGVGHKMLISDFYQHLKQGKKFPIDAAEGGKSVRLILSIYASKGERIEVLEA